MSDILSCLSSLSQVQEQTNGLVVDLKSDCTSGTVIEASPDCGSCISVYMDSELTMTKSIFWQVCGLLGQGHDN